MVSLLSHNAIRCTGNPNEPRSVPSVYGRYMTNILCHNIYGRIPVSDRSRDWSYLFFNFVCEKSAMYTIVYFYIYKTGALVDAFLHHN